MGSDVVRGGGKGGPPLPLRGVSGAVVDAGGGLSRLISLSQIGGLLPLDVGDPDRVDRFLLPKAKVSLSPPLRKTKHNNNTQTQQQKML